MGYDEMTEVTNLLEKAEKSLFQVTQTFIQNKLVAIKEIINARYEEFAEIHANPEHVQTNVVPIGYQSLDHRLG
jgi:replicative DNA helicase